MELDLRGRREGRRRKEGEVGCSLTKTRTQHLGGWGKQWFHCFSGVAQNAPGSTSLGALAPAPAPAPLLASIPSFHFPVQACIFWLNSSSNNKSNSNNNSDSSSNSDGKNNSNSNSSSDSKNNGKDNISNCISNSDSNARSAAAAVALKLK